MPFFYHIYGSGQDPYCIECVKMLDGSGYEYALTFLDKSNELKKLVSKKYDIQSFPVVIECDINGTESLLGGWKELKIALEYKDECKGCTENKKVR